jgi:hypothetical protein
MRNGNTNDLPGWRYDLEDNAFVCKVFQAAHPIHMWDGSDLTYEDLKRDNPHRAYVIAIEYRVDRIVTRFKSLNVIDQMVSVDTFPVPTPAGGITRYDWIRITLDVLLSRLTSIRDCAFLFVSEIYELPFQPRQVTLATIKRHVTNANVTGLLENIAAAARDIRDERDEHFHRGVERALGEDNIFKVAAMLEAMGRSPDFRGQDGERLSLEGMHGEVISEIQQEYHREGDLLIRLVEELFLACEAEMDARWAAKRDTAKDVRPWEH